MRKFVESNCGIVLDETKSYLVENRLEPILPLEGVNSYMELVSKATKERGEKLKHKIIDSITTNETYFFRDKKPFELPAHKLIPDIIEQQMDAKRPQ